MFRNGDDIAAALHSKAIELVRLSLLATSEAGSGHPTSASSLAHLVTALMYDVMRYDPVWPDDPLADRLVLSEGHACPIVYAAAADLGLPIVKNGRLVPMTRDDLFSLREIDSPIEGHPNPIEGFPFFPAATGSLGQGLAVAAGLALGARLDGIERRVYCIVGDGESREGQIWESLDLLADERLSEVCPIFNCNGFGQTGEVSEAQLPEALAEKLSAFGLEPVKIDGHDPLAVLDALARHAARAAEGPGIPMAIVARTVKGWGSPSLAGKRSGSHGKPAARGDELERALDELEDTASRIGALRNDDLLTSIRLPGDEARGVSQRPVSLRPPPPARPPSLAETLRARRKETALEKGRMATRDAFGHALFALARARPDVVALDADVSDSTRSAALAEVDPARFVQCRIAEQAMVSCAAGLSTAGKRPFLATFGKFFSRAYDQIEMACVSGAPLQIVASHVGVSLAADGPSQMALPDAAWFASLSRARRPDGRPLMRVLTPADAFATYALVHRMADHDGACYLRVMRPAVPFLYDEDVEFEIGGHRVVAEGGDLLIGAWGYMVHVALEACALLSEKGVSATVVDLYSLPFDADALVELARENRSLVLTLEDNYGGTLGAAVAEALAGAGDAFRLEQMYVRRVPKSGRRPDDVLEHLQLSPGHVVERALALVDLPEPASPAGV